MASSELDRLLTAHASALPEDPGTGANHYTMAAEALEALGHAGAIDESWVQGAAGYAGEASRLGTIDNVASALGHYERYGDWLDFFSAALERNPWRVVIAEWAPRLAPGISAGAFHGVIRTGHAARALRARESDARLHELQIGLAYWAARYTELPAMTDDGVPRQSLRETLEGHEYPWRDDDTDVDFSGVVERMIARPLAPAVRLDPVGSNPREALTEVVSEAAAGLIEMLIQERNRTWNLHAVTGPAAVGFLFDDVDDAGAHTLVEYARQAAIALFTAYGAPYRAGAHTRSSAPDWKELIQQSVEIRYVHTIKLIDALQRFRSKDDLLMRSTAIQWLEWI